MRVGPDTEETFDDTFFSKLNGVANALDNVEASKSLFLFFFFLTISLRTCTNSTKGLIFQLNQNNESN